MVEQQTDRMVMVAFAVIVFGVLVFVFRKGIQTIMDGVVKKISDMITNATTKATTDASITQ